MNMRVTENCEPKEVLRFFEQLCSVPHGSGNTKQISDLLVRFAEERGLEHYQDGLNNVIIIKEASAGYEDKPAVILQGHMDMVCVKAPGKEFDFEKDALQLVVDGEWLRADGTTLGGDDCIGVAMIMAALDDDSLPHPRIEGVITVDEETGMNGASGIDVTPLKGRRMLNLDSEEEGVFTVGCAGGERVDCRVPMTMVPNSLPAAVITVDGLQGGHSGIDIDKGRANANILMGRVLSGMLQKARFSFVSADGGRLDNVITSSCRAVIAAEEETMKLLEQTAAEWNAVLRREYSASDPEVRVSFQRTETPELCADPETTERCVRAMLLAPFGVQEMSMRFAGLVQTSLNQGVLSTRDGALCLSFCLRSSLESQKKLMEERLRVLYSMMGAEITVRSKYPAWEYAETSEFRDTAVKVFQRLYGRTPEMVMIHGGLECGLFSDKLPGLECVAMGPDLLDIHSPAERLNLPSAQRCWSFVKAMLAQ